MAKTVNILCYSGYRWKINDESSGWYNVLKFLYTSIKWFKFEATEEFHIQRST